MATKLHAWTNLKTSNGIVEAGSIVTKAKLGIDQHELDALVRSGAIRSMPFPELPKGWHGSVQDYRRRKLIEQLGEVEEVFEGIDLAEDDE
jgi:hypothetical protein